MKEWQIFVVIVTLVVAIFGGLIGYIIYDDYQTGQMEKACVASAGQWYSNDSGGNCIHR